MVSIEDIIVNNFHSEEIDWNSEGSKDLNEIPIDNNNSSDNSD